MQTSGGGGRDFFMLSVPLGILVFYVVGASGGPKAFLRLMERHFTALADWVVRLFT